MIDVRGNKLEIGQTVAVTRFAEIQIGELLRIVPTSNWRASRNWNQSGSLNEGRWSYIYHVKIGNQVRKIQDRHSILGIDAPQQPVVV